MAVVVAAIDVVTKTPTAVDAAAPTGSYDYWWHTIFSNNLSLHLTIKKLNHLN
jgi:hypothetical protein